MNVGFQSEVSIRNSTGSILPLLPPNRCKFSVNLSVHVVVLLGLFLRPPTYLGHCLHCGWILYL